MVVTSGGDTLSFPFHVPASSWRISALCVYHRAALSPADPRRRHHPPYFTPPAVLSPSAQDNSRFKPSLSHLDLEGCFAVEIFFFSSFAGARWMDGGIK